MTPRGRSADGESRCVMVLRFVAGFACLIVFWAGPAPAEDKVHDAAVSMLADFFADPAARADYAATHPDALKAEQSLAVFPPAIRKRIENVVLMIVKESGAGATRHIDAASSAGPEGAFRSFSPAVQREIEAIARELEKDPEFMKAVGAAR